MQKLSDHNVEMLGRVVSLMVLKSIGHIRNCFCDIGAFAS